MSMTDLRFITGPRVNCGGTHLLDTITTTYDRIVEVFGDPTIGPDADGDKTTCEWHIKFADGTIATIYDWKLRDTNYGDYGWHIGGHRREALWKVQELLLAHRRG